VCLRGSCFTDIVSWNNQWCYRYLVELLRDGPSGRKLGHGRSDSVWTLRTWLFSFLFFLAVMKWALSSLPWFAAHDRVKVHPDKQLWTETSESASRNKSFFLLTCLSQVWCQSDRKLTNCLERIIYVGINIMRNLKNSTFKSRKHVEWKRRQFK
jgi:hypothetical protein